MLDLSLERLGDFGGVQVRPVELSLLEKFCA